MVVVVNENLMDNHQFELAEKLGNDGYLEHCVCSSLSKTLEHFDGGNLKTFPPGDLEKFKTFIDNLFSAKKVDTISQEEIKRPEKCLNDQTEKEESNYLRYDSLCLAKIYARFQEITTLCQGNIMMFVSVDRMSMRIV